MNISQKNEFKEFCNNLWEYLSAELFNSLKNNETLNLNIHAENTDYVRFNKSKIRQNTHLDQISLYMSLHSENRTIHASTTLGLLDSNAESRNKVLSVLYLIRNELKQSAIDQHQVDLRNNGHSRNVFNADLPNTSQIANEICESTIHLDFAGLLANGYIIEANKNSIGQSHYYESESLFVDYSIYVGEQLTARSIKDCYHTQNWNLNDFKKSINEKSQFMSALRKPAKIILPNKYRVYLAPGAISELAFLFDRGYTNNGAFSYSDYRRGNSAFTKLIDNETQLNPLITLGEDFSMGLSPQFNHLGEISPTKLPIIEHGKIAQLLTSTASAKEFSVNSNFASKSESPRSLVIQEGLLSRENILSHLDTGLYISNLHYVSWSDQNKARFTGMTRFACFWVENGNIICPIENIRFDESFYNSWGQNLEAVTNFSETLPNLETYEMRKPGGLKIPGMVIKDFNFVS